jgi:hypothetical protein
VATALQVSDAGYAVPVRQAAWSVRGLCRTMSRPERGRRHSGRACTGPPPSDVSKRSPARGTFRATSYTAALLEGASIVRTQCVPRTSLGNICAGRRGWPVTSTTSDPLSPHRALSGPSPDARTFRQGPALVPRTTPPRGAFTSLTLLALTSGSLAKRTPTFGREV